MENARINAKRARNRIGIKKIRSVSLVIMNGIQLTVISAKTNVKRASIGIK